MKNKIIFLIGILLVSSSLNAAIRFYPRIIYMDINNKHKSIHLENAASSDNIYKLYFGYTRAVNNKFIHVKPKDLTPEDRDFCNNLKVFPKQVSLKAGEKQTVRITIKALDKSKFDKGEYYCRLYAKALPKPQALKNNIKGVKTVLKVVLTVGAPIHIRANKNVKLNLKIQPYGFRIKKGYFFYKVEIRNDSTMGLRGTITIDIFDKKTGKKVKTIKQGFVNQGGNTTLLIKKQIKDLDFNKHKYEAKVRLNDSDGVDLNYQLLDYSGINIGEFDLN